MVTLPWRATSEDQGSVVLSSTEDFGLLEMMLADAPGVHAQFLRVERLRRDVGDELFASRVLSI